MADNRCSAYSFYVPLGDKALTDFVETQSNLSMTIRLLIKGFMYNCGDEYPDVSVMDLKDLIAKANLTPELLAELAAKEKPRKSGKQIEIEPEAEKAEEKAEEIISVAPEDDDGEQGENDGVEDEEYDSADDGIEDESEITEDDNGEELDDQDPEPEPEEKPEDIIDLGADDQDPEPEIIEEPASKPEPASKSEAEPVRKPAPQQPKSQRDSYNKSQDAEESASAADLMDFMGGF